jgi:GT2 family glycosyltransferase
MADNAVLPSWSLCIATLNRADVLLRTLVFAAEQTYPPSQIVVIDVSEDWQQTAARAAEMMATWPDIALLYQTHPVRSSATQRNVGLQLCEHGIVFMIDDDSFMHRDCAAQILQVYAADLDHAVACVAARLVPDLPADQHLSLTQTDTNTAQLARKRSGRRSGTDGLKARILRTRLGRWFNRKVLFQNKDELFLKYDEPRDKQVPAGLSHLNVLPVSFMPGSAMTVRRDVALREPFDTALRYYAAFEDLDVAYRYARHGAVLRAVDAKLHHFEAAGGRVKRKKLVIFQLLNMVVFLKRHAAQPDDWICPYRAMLRRRLLGEIFKDALSGRLNFPQTAGVLTVMCHWRDVWSRDSEELDLWYPDFQKTILERL